jgi:hypothetical protein
MKKLYNRISANTFQLAGLIAGALIFTFLLFSFTDKQQAAAEKLLGVSLNYENKEISIEVVTTGCTVKGDFAFKVQNNTVTISRKKRDACKMTPQAIRFTYSLQEAGLSPDKIYIIKNRFIANPNLANIP